MDDQLKLWTSLWKWLEKHVKNKPLPLQILQKRTMNTATTILAALNDVPFSQLSFSLYFFCQDIKTKEFARAYESQIELAGANPERFAKELHKFYNNISAVIKKENLYRQFFDFLAVCSRLRTQPMHQGVSQVVINCYHSLLLQNTEYLRPDKFDFEKIVCGITTSGELMVVKDCMPNLDIPSYEIERSVRDGKISNGNDITKLLPQVFGKYGYTVKTTDDLERLNNISRIYTNHISALLPFINEYTYDILPKEEFNSFILPLSYITTHIDCDDLILQLHHRKRTLPSNGVQFEIAPDDIIGSILLKEIYYDGIIYLLYRMQTQCGDLSGYYDTKSGYFYSILLDALDGEFTNKIKAVVLTLYASVVLTDGEQILVQFSENCKQEINKQSVGLVATAYIKGGQLKNTYHPAETNGASRKNDEAFQYEERFIQGYIRRLGIGQHPSDRARAIAESLGYDLASDETYVQSFIKQVLCLKEKPVESDMV